jgi:ubiquitin-like domain-containing CTD phosphatase 1
MDLSKGSDSSGEPLARKEDPTFQTIIVKWSGNEYVVDDLTEIDTVAVLKHVIYRKTNVRPERQKLLNLKYKGKQATDDLSIQTLELKPNFKLMMVGSLEKDIESANQRPDDIPEIVDDFEEPENSNEIPFENKDVYLAKIARRVKEYKIEIINPLRDNKKLLVLDIDYTLFDHRSAAEQPFELMRPYLHEFLTKAYKQYEIVIWSATSMKWIIEKMKLLGVSSHPDYKIAFYLDSGAMITLHCPSRGVVEVKPLGVIWGKFPAEFSSKNTIMVQKQILLFLLLNV